MTIVSVCVDKLNPVRRRLPAGSSVTLFRRSNEIKALLLKDILHLELEAFRPLIAGLQVSTSKSDG